MKSIEYTGCLNTAPDEGSIKLNCRFWKPYNECREHVIKMQQSLRKETCEGYDTETVEL